MKIKATQADAYRLVHDGVLALARAERAGIRLDTGYCDRKIRHLSRRINHQHKQLQETKLYKQWERIFRDKTNIHSNNQLAHMLYKVLKLEPTKTTDTGQGSTDEDALRRLGLPEVDILLAIRKLCKIKSTYLTAFLREHTAGYLHPVYHLHTVKTYRSSSAEPNFQNIPKRDRDAMQICRRAIIPRAGNTLVEADFSALEVNISQCYHHDPKMLEYLTGAGDMHADMAKQIFILDELDKTIPAYNTLRQAAKNGFVFPQFYGDYYLNNAHSLCDWAKLPAGTWKAGAGIEMPDGKHISDHLRNQGIKSFDRFAEHMNTVENDFWNNRFAVYNNWRRSWVEQYRRRGYLRMHTGFVCSGIMRRNEIINYPIQGSAFHCLLLTFIELDNYIQRKNLRSKLIGQIHDSILLDADPDELPGIKQRLRTIVTKTLPKRWPWIVVPLEIDVDVYGVDQSWATPT